MGWDGNPIHKYTAYAYSSVASENIDSERKLFYMFWCSLFFQRTKGLKDGNRGGGGWGFPHDKLTG